MNRSGIIAVLILLLVTTSPAVPAGTQVISTEGVRNSSGSVSLIMTPRGPAAAFDGEGGYMFIAHYTDGLWHSRRILPGSTGGFISAGSDIILGYTFGGQAYTVTSNDGGDSFQAPVAITSYDMGVPDMDLSFDRGKVHAVFPGRDYDRQFNYAFSPDSGGTYHLTTGFTSSSDSSFTGFSGRIKAEHGLIYTVYQDYNQQFAVKYAFSPDGGKNWHITPVMQEGARALADIASDPNNPDLVYITHLSTEALGVTRIEGASTMNPAAFTVYLDPEIVLRRNSVKSSRIGVLDNGIVVMIYQDSSGTYWMTSSWDKGNSWTYPEPVGQALISGYSLFPDIEISGNTILFAYHDSRGNIMYFEASGEHPVYSAGSDGLVHIPSVSSPFRVELEDTSMVLFEAPESGMYTITYPERDMFYMSLFETEAGELLGNNFDGESVLSSFSHQLEEGCMYILGIGTLDDNDTGRTVQVEIIRGQD